MPLLYQSKTMAQVVGRAKQYARSAAAVLITGESGTGKELLARLIHETSARNCEPLIRLNCTSLSDGLFESELFGHERGSFTGAVAERPGRLEAAASGTLFLDEVGELSLSLQPKLLHVLEDGEFERVGSNATQRLRARIVAATNRELLEDVSHQRFRRDLYYRLNVLPLNIPPLRDRREDVPLLVQHFVGQFRHEAACPVKGVTSAAMKRLCDYHWPGNVRQLRNVVHRACVLATAEMIEAADFSEVDEPCEEIIALPAAMETLPLRDIERQVILKRLRIFDGNKTAAARALGVTSRTLRNKVAEYDRLNDAG